MRTGSPAQIASFITALRVKGGTPEEITAAARVIKDKASAIHAHEIIPALIANIAQKKYTKIAMVVKNKKGAGGVVVLE